MSSILTKHGSDRCCRRVRVTGTSFRDRASSSRSLRSLSSGFCSSVTRAACSDSSSFCSRISGSPHTTASKSSSLTFGQSFIMARWMAIARSLRNSRSFEGAKQASSVVIRRPSGGHQEAIGRPSGGHREAIRRPSGGHEAIDSTHLRERKEGELPRRVLASHAAKLEDLRQ